MNRKIVAFIIALLGLCLMAGAFAEGECSSYLEYGKAVAGLSQGKSLNSEELASRILMRSQKPMTNLDSFGALAVVSGPQNHYTLQFSSVEGALSCLEALKADENVIYAQQDSLVSASETQAASSDAKADPYLSWGAKAMGADDLAASVTASGSITVAVIDSGVASHPFINSRVKTGGVDFTDPSYADGRHDVNGHGTHVAGTIVDLTQGLNVNILPVRVLGDNGSGKNSNVCNGIRYAAESGAKIINMSLGGELFSPYDVSSEEADAIRYAISKGVTIVVAAGNSSMDTASFQPACFDEVIVVAAIDSAYNVASFSNFGDSVDVCAPGVNITSCSINGGYTDFNGTSMASPHVAAIAAMVKLQNPSFSPARVENYIKSHCLDLGKEGWDRVFGNGLPCFAQDDVKTEGDYTYKTNSDGAIITAYAGTDANVVIPDTLGGVNVVAVEKDAFKANATIESLVVPGGVKEIGNFSFAECPLLKTVAFGEGVIRIGDSAFADCAALEDVKLPDSLENLGGEVFKSCTALKSLALPSNIKAMGAYALSESGITSITIPASLGCVPARVFTECKSLESVTIEEGVKRIDPLAFDICTALKSISIPESVTIIDQAAFRGAGLEKIKLSNVETLGMGAFMYCENLVSAELPETLGYIDEIVFLDCAELVEVTVPRSVESIAEDSFEGCKKVALHGYTGSACEEYAEQHKIPFVSIGYQTLMTELEPVTYETLEVEPGQIIYAGDLYTYEPEDATLTDLEWTSSDKTVCDAVNHQYGAEVYLALATYAKGACTVTGTAKDGSGLSISINVVVGDRQARTVRVSKSTLTVKVGETSTLTAVVLPEGVDQTILWSSDNQAVATVGENGEISALSAGVATITAQAAEYPALSDMCVVTVTADEPIAGEFAYRAIDQSTAAVTGYTGTEKALAIPASIDGLKIVQIDDAAFYRSDMTSVTIPESVKAIGERAFAECKSLESVSLPDGLTMLALDAFKGCKKLPKVQKVELRLEKFDGGFILRPMFTPQNTAAAYSITTSGKNSATVSALGLVTPKTDEYFTLTLKAGGKKALLGVNGGEPYAAAKVTINGKAKRSVKTGKTLQLSFTVKPESARVVATWTSSDPEVATVDQSGLVTPVTPGKVKITLSTDLGLTDFVTVTVKKGQEQAAG